MYLVKPEKKAVATQGNELIGACYTMSLNEKRLLMLGVSQLDSKQFTLEKVTFEVDAKKWLEYFDDKNAWRSIKRAADKLLTRTVKLDPDTGHIQKLSWFDKVDYYQSEGRIVVEFGRNISSRLINLYDNFTSIKLLAISQFTSIYSIRLYELLSQFQSTGYRRMSVDDFRFAMDCVNKYKDTRKLNAQILQTALKEVNNKSDLVCKVRNIKKGTLITDFEFIFASKPPQVI